MNIRKVRYRNFYSAKDVTVNFEDYEGIVVIDGENGSGKSTIFEAVIWGITGRTIRKSTEKSMVNNQSQKNCIVEVWVDEDKYIKRTRKPTGLEFLVGEENLTQEDARATQFQIEKVLGTNYKVINASMVFGQHSTEDFLSATKDDKRSIIRNFLSVDEIFDTRDKIKDYKSLYNNQKKISESALLENEKQVKDLENRLSKIEEVEAPDCTLDSILKAEDKYSEYRSEVAIVSSKLFEINCSIDTARDAISTGEYCKEDVCRSCNQKYVKEVTDKDIESYNNKLNSLIVEASSKESELEYLVTKADDAKPPISSKQYASIEKSIQESKLRKTYENQLDSLEVRGDELKRENISAISSYEVMRFWEKAFSEQGIIKYIIRNVLSTFNDKCNTYLYLISGGKYYIEFDDQLDEKIYTEKRVIYHEALSGGEKRKINLSVMLALQDLLSLTESNKTDLLFFDEIGENLDADGMYGLYILLRQIQKNNKKVFLITHNEHMKNLLDQYPRMLVTKEQGITTIN